MKKVNHSHEEIMKSIPNKGFFGHPKGLSTLFLTVVLGEIQLLWYESHINFLSIL